MFFVSNKLFFISKNRFHACDWLKKNLSKQHTKGSRNQIGCAKYTVAVIEICFFGALVCSQIPQGSIAGIILKEVTPNIGYYSL